MAGHTPRNNQKTLGIGMVHVSPTIARSTGLDYRAYPDEQIDGLVRLLGTLAHGYGLDVQSIRSQEEVDPPYDREITDRMDENRQRVGRLLGQWRMEGRRPSGAEVRVAAPQ